MGIAKFVEEKKKSKHYFKKKKMEILKITN